MAEPLSTTSSSDGALRVLIEAKHRKKQADENAKLLLNRIALLKKEQGKVVRTVKRSQKRTEELLEAKAGNVKRAQQWAQIALEHEEKQRALQQKHLEEEQRIRERRKEQAVVHHQQKKQAVSKQREESSKSQQQIEAERLQAVRRKQQKAENVRRQTERAQEQRRRQQLEIEAKKRLEYEEKAKAEAAEAKRAEKAVQLLQRQEQEWIAKLKKAQMDQTNAWVTVERKLKEADEQLVSRQDRRRGTSVSPVKRRTRS